MEKYYKYKPIKSIEDLDKLINIFNNGEIYFPKPSQLNDPFEARKYTFYPAVMGHSLYMAAKKAHPIFDSMINEYRIMSFTKNYLNQVMWNMYASEYKGVCIGFVNNGSFNEVQSINYENQQFSFYYKNIL